MTQIILCLKPFLFFRYHYLDRRYRYRHRSVRIIFLSQVSPLLKIVLPPFVFPPPNFPITEEKLWRALFVKHKEDYTTRTIYFLDILHIYYIINALTLSWRRLFSYRNQSIDLLCKSMDWFLYDNGFRHERVKMNPNFIYRKDFHKVKYFSMTSFWCFYC